MSIKINEDLKKTIKNKEKKPSTEINFNDCFIFQRKSGEYILQRAVLFF